MEKSEDTSKKTKVIIAIVFGISVFGMLIIMSLMYFNKSPLIGKWETDYEHYFGMADQNVMHFTFNPDGTLIYGTYEGVYEAKDGILTINLNGSGKPDVKQEYKLEGDTLVLNQALYLKRVNEFEKTLTD